MNNLRRVHFFSAILSFVLAVGFTAAQAQDAPDVGPHPPQPVKPMESHIGNITGHSAAARSDYRRYCAGCHGDLGDGNGENAVWLDPKPRNFTLATFKCRSTVTGTLPTDEDLFNTIARGLTNSNMPIWNTFTKQQRADLVAYIKTFSPRWEKEKAGEPIKIPAEPPITIESISHGKALFTKLECWKCHGPRGQGRRSLGCNPDRQPGSTHPSLQLCGRRGRFPFQVRLDERRTSTRFSSPVWMERRCRRSPT